MFISALEDISHSLLCVVGLHKMAGFFLIGGWLVGWLFFCLFFCVMSKSTVWKHSSIAAVVERAETGSCLLLLIEVAAFICAAWEVCACSPQDTEAGLLCLCMSCVPLWQKSEISLPCSSWQYLDLDTGEKKVSVSYSPGKSQVAKHLLFCRAINAVCIGNGSVSHNCCPSGSSWAIARLWVFPWDVEGEWKQWHGRTCSLGSEKCKLK